MGIIKSEVKIKVDLTDLELTEAERVELLNAELDLVRSCRDGLVGFKEESKRVLKEGLGEFKLEELLGSLVEKKKVGFWEKIRGFLFRKI